LRNFGIVNYHADQVQLHNFNARLQLLSEGEFDQKWLPAVTVGVHYKYNYVFEGNVVVFVTGNFALAAESKEQPRDYQAIGDLVKLEGDWATLDAAYVVNKHLTLAVGYGLFGNVLNHEANGVWGLTTKWEF
jgi:hypothetical protein